MDPGLRICLANDSFPPVIDGVANVVLNYARILHDRGAAVTVATPEYPGADDDYPFPVYRYPSSDTTARYGYRAGRPLSPSALSALEKTEPRLIHAHCPLTACVLARTLREITGAPLVLTYHTKFDVDINKAISSGLLRTAALKLILANIEAADHVWTVSRGAGENLRSLGYEGDYTVVENGVDYPKGRVSQEKVNALWEEFSIPRGKPVFLFVGRMMWYKGIRLILEALSLRRRAGKDFTMVFTGDGQDFAEIRALAASLNLTDHCVFTGAVRDRERLRAIFCLADLFLFPSEFDTNGIVVREAAACSLPSLLIEGSCAAEGIINGRNGLLCRPYPQDIAQTLSIADADPGALKELGRRASDELYLSWEDAVIRAQGLYGDILSRPDRGLRRREAFGDDFLALAADALAALNRSRALTWAKEAAERLSSRSD